MSIENKNPITYMDWAKTRDPDGSTADIVELLAQSNPIIEDAVVREGNLPIGHQTTIRTGYGQSTWRRFNYGVQPSKSKTAQVVDRAGMLEDYTEVDKSIANLEADRAAYLAQETNAKWEEMNQQHAHALFYNDTNVHPERPLGLLPRFNDASADNARNILDGKVGGASGGSASPIYTSIWLVTWDLDTCFEFFPKGSMVGLTMEDKGQQTLFDANGGRYEGYRIHHKHDFGLTVRDWRYIVRIANVDMANDGNAADGDKHLIDLMTRAVNKLQTRGKGRPVFYVNREVHTVLDLQAQNRSNMFLQMGQWAGSDVPMFRGFPIRMCEILDASDEARVLGLPTLV